MSWSTDWRNWPVALISRGSDNACKKFPPQEGCSRQGGKTTNWSWIWCGKQILLGGKEEQEENCKGGGGVVGLCGNRQHAWAVIKSNQIIIIQKCGANCVYRFFRTVQLTFAVCRDADRDSDGDGDSDVAVDSGQSNNYQWQQTSSHEAALPSSSIATPTPALRLRLGLPHTQPGDFRININLCAQLKPWISLA